MPLSVDVSQLRESHALYERISQKELKAEDLRK